MLCFDHLYLQDSYSSFVRFGRERKFSLDFGLRFPIVKLPWLRWVFFTLRQFIGLRQWFKDPTECHSMHIIQTGLSK